MDDSRNIGKKAVSDFGKAFSCSYSITKNLSHVLGVDADPSLQSAVVGFGSGVSTMGDVCGVLSGGTLVLGRRFGHLPSSQLYTLCSEYFLRLERRLGTPDCGRIHGGKHLASNFRRAVLTGKVRKCSSMVRHGSEILVELAKETEQGNLVVSDDARYHFIDRMSNYFEGEDFHCCQSVLAEIQERTAVALDAVMGPSKGFCGGIGFNGTLCGAIAGGILYLGVKNSVDLGRSGYRDTLKIALYGLIKSDRIFRDEKRFPAARLFDQCQQLYRAIEKEYGGAHCRGILGFRLDSENGSQQYVEEKRIDTCRRITRTVVEAAMSI